LSAPQRLRIDLRRLPRWAQYAVSLTVVAVVVALAARSSRGAAPPFDASRLSLALGAVFLLLLAVGLGGRLRRRPPP